MLFIFYKKSIQGLKLYLAQTNSLLILIFKRFRRGIINLKINDGVFFFNSKRLGGVYVQQIYFILPKTQHVLEAFINIHNKKDLFGIQNI